MREINLEIRVVCYREDDLWVAHCLEFDVLGSGETKKDALNGLSEAILLQLEHSVLHDNPRNLFRPADSETFHRFAMGREFQCNAYTGQVKIRTEFVDIPGCEAREYLDEVEEGNHLTMA